MALKRLTQSEVNEYYNSDRLNQSRLKLLLGGFHFFMSKIEEEPKLFYEEKESLVIGSAVDDILTGGDSAFDRKYHVSNIESKPSDAEMSIVQMVFQMVLEEYGFDDMDDSMESYQDIITYAITEHKWRENWKLDTRIDKIIDVGNEYYADLGKGYGKQIISQEEEHTIKAVVDSFRNNPLTEHYFDHSFYEDSTSIDIYYQYPIYFNHRGFECKALLDIVIVYKSPDTGEIMKIQPIDIKTTHANTLQFKSAAKTYRYDIQCSFYKLALQKAFELPENSSTLLPFLFLVESTSTPGTPLIYKTSPEFESIGRFGRSEIKDKESGIKLRHKILGIEDLFDDYTYYTETAWREDKSIVENVGIFELNWE